MPVSLNAQASAALAEIVHRNNGQLPVSVEAELQKLEQQSAAQGADHVHQLTLPDVEKILQQAMPNQQQHVKDACDVASGYHPGGRNAQFLTQILSAKVEKVDEVRAQQPTVPAAPRRYDPYHAEFTLDPKAKSMLLFNARNVDGKGNALLMKVVMRMTPKVEAAMVAAEKEIEPTVARIFGQLRRHNAALTETDVRAWLTLPTDGSQDRSGTQWLTQVSANAAWMTQNAPGVLEGKKVVADKIVEMNDVKKRFLDEELPKIDLSRYRREPADALPDVHLVGAKATFVRTADIHEAEFDFGDPLKQVSLNANNKEISSSVWVRPENEQFNRAWQDPVNGAGRMAAQDRRTQGDNLDRRPVVTFDERVRVAVKAKEGAVVTPGAWLTEPNGLKNLDVTLHLDRGIIFEPGGSVTVNVLGNTVAASVAKDDAQLLGNAPVTQAIDTANANQTLSQFLTSPVTRSSWAQEGKTDAENKQFTVANLVYANAANLKVGARALKPLGDTILKQADLEANKITLEAHPIADPENDGVKLHLTLGEGFLGAEKDKGSVKGYTIQVGYRDENNQWIEAKSRTVGSETLSKREEFEFSIPDFDALQKPKDAQGNGTKRVEIRIYNADGIPAERIQVPFRDVSWTDG
jgi:hypothetical protein